MSLYWPVAANFVVTQSFGPTNVTAEDPITWPGGQGIPGGYYPHFHRGIDLGDGTCGDPITAAGDGTVHFAGLITVPDAPGGKQSLITLDHGSGLASIYIHEATWIVFAGNHVTAGQKIAVVGKVGTAACHLHWGVKSGVDFGKNVLADDNGSWLDPEGVVTVSAPNGPDVAVYAPGYTATLKAGAKVRTSPDPAGPVRRVVPAAGETWTAPWAAVGKIKGGGSQWYFRLYSGQWEYVANSDVPIFVPPPSTGIPLAPGLYKVGP